MRFRRIRPIVIKEFRQIRRDLRSLMILVGFPALLVFVFGYALNLDVKHISLAVFDQDRTQRSRDFIQSFIHSEYFDLTHTIASYREADDLLNRGDADLVIVLPPDFSANILAGRDARIQILVDGSNANTATTVIEYVSSLIQTYSIDLTSEVFARRGREVFLPIDFRPRIWYNPELSSAKFLVPGLIGFILMLSAVISTSLSVVREKERGTMEQIIVSPLHTVEVILGKTTAYLVLALFASVLVLIIGFVAFDISIRGSIIWLYVGILVFLIGSLGQGLLVSTIAQTQQVAFMLSVFSSLLPSFLLSGFVFPIRSMPVTLQILSNITPAKFFLVIVRAIILKGAGPSAFWKELLAMSAFAAAMITISSVRMFKRSD